MKFISSFFKFLYIGAVTRQRGSSRKNYIGGGFMLSLSSSFYMLTVLNLTIGRQMITFNRQFPAYVDIQYPILIVGMIAIWAAFFWFFPNIGNDHKESKRKVLAYNLFLLYFFVGIGLGSYTWAMSEEWMRNVPLPG